MNNLFKKNPELKYLLIALVTMIATILECYLLYKFMPGYWSYLTGTFDTSRRNIVDDIPTFISLLGLGNLFFGFVVYYLVRRITGAHRANNK
ncbi:MAG: hypothetical protein JWN89_343 [Parcubacteria group bacterium]|nr:hypothetical protein [Parcubacteria group bacterium]